MEDRFEETISLWSDDGRRGITLKNLQTGKTFSFVIKHSFIIGRNKKLCNLQVTTDDLYISGKHLNFINDRDGVFVEDMHSKNGTRVNGKPLVTRTRLRSGDILRMGKTDFEVIL